jgi:hypothetical protein
LMAISLHICKNRSSVSSYLNYRVSQLTSRCRLTTLSITRSRASATGALVAVSMSGYFFGRK